MHWSHTGHSRGRHAEQLVLGSPEAEYVISLNLQSHRHPDLSSNLNLSISGLDQVIISLPAVREMACLCLIWPHWNSSRVAILKHLILL